MSESQVHVDLSPNPGMEEYLKILQDLKESVKVSVESEKAKLEAFKNIVFEIRMLKNTLREISNILAVFLDVYADKRPPYDV